MQIASTELKEKLEKHQLWLRHHGKIGERADFQKLYLAGANFQGMNLCNANFEGACLKGANFERATLMNVNFAKAYLEDASFAEANLVGAILSEASLYGTNFKGANLDFSCLPLWRGSLTADFDDRQLKQIAYHLVKAGLQSSNASEKTKTELAKLINFANGFHRVEECGKIEREEAE